MTISSLLSELSDDYYEARENFINADNVRAIEYWKGYLNGLGFAIDKLSNLDSEKDDEE